MTHAPTPWNMPARMTYTIADAQGRVITSMRTGRDVSPEEAISNAHFIIAAVNAHEELLAALEELLEWEISMAGLGHPRLHKARAAIAKAKQI